MMTSKRACALMRALPDVTIKDHFGSDAFRANGRIFATVWHAKNEVNLMLTPAQQETLLERDGDGFSKVPNKWGDGGATTAHLSFLEEDEFLVGMELAFATSAVKKTRVTTAPKKTAPKKRAAKKAPAKKVPAKKARS